MHEVDSPSFDSLSKGQFGIWIGSICNYASTKLQKISNRIQCNSTFEEIKAYRSTRRRHLRIANPHHHVAFKDIGDLAVELVKSTVQDEEGFPGRGHEVLSEQSAARNHPVPAAPRPLG